MKVIISGGRDYADYESFKAELNILLAPDGEGHGIITKNIEIVAGACSDPKGVLTFTRQDGTKVYGADGMAERYAEEYKFPIQLFPAKWTELGRSAGPIRNSKMAEYGTHCICFWDKKSRGTADMIKKANNHGLNFKEINY